MSDRPPAEGGEDPRVRLAGERTLLAWLRTGLALMGFGFVVARFGLFVRELAPLHPDAGRPSTGVSVWIGIALILLGVGVNLAAAREHLRFSRRLDRREPYRPPGLSLGVTLATALAVSGGVMAIYLIILRP